MQTEVKMKRLLFGVEISQKSKSEFFNATDLVKAGNKWRRSNDLPDFKMQEFLRTDKTIEFRKELEIKFGHCLEIGKGRNAQTWVHPLLFIDIALSISPQLKIEVYEWLFDELIKNRNNSGDSYKKMCGYLYANCNNKSTFHRGVSKTAEMIQKAVGVTDWQRASESQLKLRDKIHENISLLADVLRDNNQAIRLGIQKALL
jgi:KilA-N domain